MKSFMCYINKIGYIQTDDYNSLTHILIIIFE